MPPVHQFGGQWTEDKLKQLQKYLHAYLTIFKRNKKASWFQTMYVDAFAGTGNRSYEDTSEAASIPLFPDEADVKGFQAGSVRIALDIEPGFDHYLFIEQNPTYAQELEQLREEFPKKHHHIRVVPGDANQVLIDWCAHTNWQTHRAVVFLDPYGMQVEWATLEALASTRAVDLWILFPLGQGINRLLTKKAPPEGALADKLTRTFGTSEWREAFYRSPGQQTMFDIEERNEKVATFESIAAFFVERLKQIFSGVAENSRSLYNSKNVPIYLLCFASANPKGAPTAIKIAQHILQST